MKVTFVLPFAGLQGGVRVISILADRLRRRGHEVVVISRPQVVSIRRAIKSLVLAQGWPKPEPSYFERLSVEHRILEKVRPVTDGDVPDADVVVATYYTTASGVLHLSPAKGAKAILIQNYEVEEGKSIPALDASWRMPMHKIVISNWLVELARERFGDTVVSHVPYGVDSEQFKAPTRQKQPVPTVGMLFSKFSLKGCRTSLAALERVAKKLPSLRLICFGADRPGPVALRMPANAEFHYRPQQDKLRQLYAQCDVWLCASQREGFHMPPMEAMACRCPVVSTRVGGPMDMIEPGVNGYLVNIGDVAGLADRTLSVLNLAEENWQRMSAAACRTASRYTWEESTNCFNQALELAIERERRGDWKTSRAPKSV